MAGRSFFRGHPLIWIEDKWVYEDNHAEMPACGGEIRPCKKCGVLFPLGEGEVDPCLGVLPGVDNACCGHGVRSDSYVCFTNGTVLKDFIVDKSPVKLATEIERNPEMDKTIICPGCGWIGQDEGLDREGACPNCHYENGLPPYRLLTLSKMLNDEGVYDDVYMDLFLQSLFKFLGYPDNQDEWPDYEVVHFKSIDGG